MRLASTIVPEELRARHAKGLERYLATGKSNILNKRLEMMALHSDGTEFAIELTITQIGKAVPPIFAGFCRDVSEIMKLNVELEERVERGSGRTPSVILLRGSISCIGSIALPQDSHWSP